MENGLDVLRNVVVEAGYQRYNCNHSADNITANSLKKKTCWYLNIHCKPVFISSVYIQLINR